MPTPLHHVEQTVGAGPTGTITIPSTTAGSLGVLVVQTSRTSTLTTLVVTSAGWSLASALHVGGPAGVSYQVWIKNLTAGLTSIAYTTHATTSQCRLMYQEWAGIGTHVLDFIAHSVNWTAAGTKTIPGTVPAASGELTISFVVSGDNGGSNTTFTVHGTTATFIANHTGGSGTTASPSSAVAWKTGTAGAPSVTWHSSTSPGTVTGTHLTGATAVHFGTGAATTVHVTSATSLTCKTPAHAAGTVAVSVTTPTGTGTKPAAFTFTAPAAGTPVHRPGWSQWSGVTPDDDDWQAT